MANEKKVAFITGANRGLGKESARQLGKLGVIVVIGSRDAKKGEAVAAEFKSQGIAAESVKCDVTNPADHHGVYEYLASKHGKLDILINNAGVSLERLGEPGGAITSTVSQKILKDTFEANFFSTVALTQAALAIDPQIAGRADCESIEHSGIADAARDAGVADL